jgi:hypothetical protein
MVAKILGTEVLASRSGSTQRCFFANIRLPLTIIKSKGQAGDITEDEALPVFYWMYHTAHEEFDTYFQIKIYSEAFWVRFSAQIYLEMDDFIWGADRLVELCDRVKKGEWKKSPRSTVAP